jgi:uncharacterized protein
MGFTRPARLLRDVPEKAEFFPCCMPRDHHELQPLVERHHGFSRSMRKALVFFRFITQRMKAVCAALRHLSSKQDQKAKFMLQLSSEQLQITKDILAQHAPGRRVCAHGSRALGTARATSDLDLLILGSEALTPEQRAELKLAFSESDLPFFVDVIEQSRISTNFFEQISKHAEPLTHDFARFAGSWSNQESQEFDNATLGLRAVEPDIWK